MNGIDLCSVSNDSVEDKSAGGSVQGVGLHIDWQAGPLGRGKDRVEPNGAFVETVIAAALQRLEFYEEGEFACHENVLAIEHLSEALEFLEKRTAKREERGVEGTHIV